jgi:hypothetical protein
MIGGLERFEQVVYVLDQSSHLYSHAASPPLGTVHTAFDLDAWLAFMCVSECVWT